MLSWRRILAIVAALVVLAVACFVAALAVFCQFTLHAPRTLPVMPVSVTADYPKATWQTRSIQAFDGVRLDSWFIRPDARSGSCVMVLHGIGDSRQGSAGYAAIFLKQGYSVLLPDSRGHGTSGGEFVTYGLLEKRDVLSWAQWLREQNCKALYALGESLGGSILIQAAVGADFRAIVAESAFADLPAIAEFRVRQMFHLPRLLESELPEIIVRNSMIFAKFRYGLDLGQVSPLESMSRSSTPALLMHGLQDSRTRYWHSEALARANPRSVLWLVPNAEHTGAYAAAPEEFRRRVLTWFAEH